MIDYDDAAAMPPLSPREQSRHTQGIVVDALFSNLSPMAGEMDEEHVSRIAGSHDFLHGCFHGRSGDGCSGMVQHGRDVLCCVIRNALAPDKGRLSTRCQAQP